MILFIRNYQFCHHFLYPLSGAYLVTTIEDISLISTVPLGEIPFPEISDYGQYWNVRHHFQYALSFYLVVTVVSIIKVIDAIQCRYISTVRKEWFGYSIQKTRYIKRLIHIVQHIHTYIHTHIYIHTNFIFKHANPHNY